MSLQISVVIPVKNEQDNITPLVKEIVTALQSYEFEIIVVNDGSTDKTPVVLEELKSEQPMLRVITHKNACGQSVAVDTGVRHAQYEWIGVLDGDGQNDPADFPKLIEWVEQQKTKYALAIGQRGKRKDTAVRRIASRLAFKARKLALGDDTPDTGCGLKVFNRDVYIEEFPFFNHMHRYMSALMVRIGGQVMSIPVAHRPRGTGQSNYGVLDRLWVGIFDIIGVRWLIKRYKRPEIVKG